jgi:hypothetical protein
VTVAALFVDPKGVYSGLEGVEVWDEARDARLYAGPWPVVAHPPCARWSVMAAFVEAVHGYPRGDDGGGFAAAIDAVRKWGGVLEHPAYSAAWDRFGLPEPLVVAGWTGGLCGGWSAYVEQGRYGGAVRKATWLYAYGCELFDLRWGRDATGDSYDSGWRMNSDYHKQGKRRIGSDAAAATPPAFAHDLLTLARTATPDNRHRACTCP